jgi:hypothetical protein
VNWLQDASAAIVASFKKYGIYRRFLSQPDNTCLAGLVAPVTFSHLARHHHPKARFSAKFSDGIIVAKHALESFS